MVATASLANHSAVSWKQRFLAWWEGQDLEDRPQQLAGGRKRRQAQPEEEVVDLAPARVDLLERLWGQGHNVPWDTPYVAQFVKRIGLPDNKNMVLIGAGLGAPAYELAAMFEGPVTAFESDPGMLEIALARQAAAGKDSKVAMHALDPENLDLPKRGFGAVWINQVLFQNPDSFSLLKKLDSALTPSGHLVIVDYVMIEPSKNRQKIDEWMASESVQPHLWSIEDYHDNLKNLRLQILDTYDMTEHYQARIRAAWSNFQDLVVAMRSRGEPAELLMDLLLREADFWTRRSNAFEKGGIKVYMVHARKPNAGRAMSDW